MRLSLLIFALCVSIVYAASATTPNANSNAAVAQIYWSDGDSGRIDGKPFRLANIDAPEKGGIGSIGGAKCEKERERAYEIEITNTYGEDKYGRLVVDLSVNGEDLGTHGIETGHFGAWPHRGERALTKKPDWCGILFAAL